MRALLNSCRKLNLTMQKSLILIAVGIFTLVSLTGCGSDGSSVEIPKGFIRDFIAKHETMVDRSLVYYYAKQDQSEIAEQVDIACRISRAKGTFTTLEQATFDFSELQIELVDKKEEYIDDEPVMFVKVSVKGNYIMQLPEAVKRIDANEIIILQMAHNEWKITQTANPWS